MKLQEVLEKAKGEWRIEPESWGEPTNGMTLVLFGIYDKATGSKIGFTELLIAEYDFHRHYSIVPKG